MSTIQEEANLSAHALDARRKEKKVALIDVRSSGEFRGEHIAGAHNLPLHELQPAQVQETARKTGAEEVCLLCQGGVRSAKARAALGDIGLPVTELAGGLNAWKQAGLPVEGSGGMNVMRQVQVTVGASVLAGVLLGWQVHPGFYAVSAFFGAGLLFAGLSGTCALALVLARMPWNR